MLEYCAPALFAHRTFLEGKEPQFPCCGFLSPDRVTRPEREQGSRHGERQTPGYRHLCIKDGRHGLCGGRRGGQDLGPDRVPLPHNRNIWKKTLNRLSGDSRCWQGCPQPLFHVYRRIRWQGSHRRCARQGDISRSEEKRAVLPDHRRGGQS